MPVPFASSAWIKAMTAALQASGRVDALAGQGEGGPVTGRLKPQGSMASIMRNTRAAQELVNCCTRIETEFPV